MLRRLEELCNLHGVSGDEGRVRKYIKDIAKGYADCVAYMSSEGISVAVAAPESGLLQTDIALITDIILTQSDYELDEIRIVEVR